MRALNISCIYTETVFSCKTIKLSEQFGQQYKHLDALLDELIRIKFRRFTMVLLSTETNRRIKSILMQIWKSADIFVFTHKHNLSKVSHYSTSCFLRYARPRYFKGRNFCEKKFRVFAIFGQIHESLKPRNI